MHGMGSPERNIAQAKDFIAPPGYLRHRPETTLLYRLVAEDYPRWIAHSHGAFQAKVVRPLEFQPST